MYKNIHRLFYTFIIATTLLIINSQQSKAADVSLMWDASITPTVVGYKVYVGNASRVYNTPIVIGNITSFVVSNLVAGTYFFAVTAFDASGNESDYSNEVSTTITSNTTLQPVTITGDLK